MSEEEPQQEDLNDQLRERRRSLDEIIKLGFDPYPHKFERTHTINQLIEKYRETAGPDLDSEKPRTRAAGRIHAINKMGKAAFIRFTDGREMIRIYLKSNEMD